MVDFSIFSKASYQQNNAPNELLGFKKLPLPSANSVVYINPQSRTIIMAIRGTNPKNFSDLGADALILVNQLSNGNRYQALEKRLHDLHRQYGKSYKIILTGHSLGGALARELLINNTSKIHQIHIYNSGTAPSQVLGNITHSLFAMFGVKKYKELRRKTHVYRIRFDPISFLSFTQPGKHHTEMGSLNAHAMDNFLDKKDKKILADANAGVASPGVAPPTAPVIEKTEIKPNEQNVESDATPVEGSGFFEIEKYPDNDDDETEFHIQYIDCCEVDDDLVDEEDLYVEYPNWPNEIEFPLDNPQELNEIGRSLVDTHISSSPAFPTPRIDFPLDNPQELNGRIKLTQIISRPKLNVVEPKKTISFPELDPQTLNQIALSRKKKVDIYSLQIPSRILQELGDNLEISADLNPYLSVDSIKQLFVMYSNLTKEVLTKRLKERGVIVKRLTKKIDLVESCVATHTYSIDKMILKQILENGDRIDIFGEQPEPLKDLTTEFESIANDIQAERNFRSTGRR
jgi:hypothetical protein